MVKRPHCGLSGIFTYAVKSGNHVQSLDSGDALKMYEKHLAHLTNRPHTISFSQYAFAPLGCLLLVCSFSCLIGHALQKGPELKLSEEPSRPVGLYLILSLRGTYVSVYSSPVHWRGRPLVQWGGAAMGRAVCIVETKSH